MLATQMAQPQWLKSMNSGSAVHMKRRPQSSKSLPLSNPRLFTFPLSLREAGKDLGLVQVAVEQESIPSLLRATNMTQWLQNEF